MTETIKIEKVSVLCAKCVRGHDDLGGRVPIECLLHEKFPCEGCGKVLTRATAHSAYTGQTQRIEVKDGFIHVPLVDYGKPFDPTKFQFQSGMFIRRDEL